MQLFFKSEFSFFESIIKIENVIDYAKKNSIKQLFLIDKNLHASEQFISSCQKENIECFLGLEISENNNTYYAIAYNQKTLQKLFVLSSHIYIENQNLGNTKIDDNLLDGLFFIIPNSCKDTKIKQKLTKNKNLFKEVNTLKLATYLKNDDKEIVEIWNKVGNIDKFENYNAKDATDLLLINIKNSDNFANRLKANIHDAWDCFQIKTEKDFFEHCLNKMKSKDEITPQIIDRLKYECSIIAKFNFIQYFLIVADYVDFAKQSGIMVGTGRGSAVGSLTAYALGITKINPIPYGLIFERFLNPDRVSFPDIDVDFQDNRRQEVIDYIFKKYGKSHVAHITTFQTLGARMAIKDVARIMGYDPQEINRFNKAIPLNVLVSFDEILEKVKTVKAFYYKNEKNKKLIDTAKKLLNLVRQPGIHAAGLIVCKDDLSNITPTYTNVNGHILTQVDMDHLEKFNLIKMDLLGLKNLSIIAEVITLIYKAKGTILDINKIPLNDKKTFDLLKKGLTTGIFQLESTGMTNLIVKLNPHDIEDLVTANSLYRPGPNEFIEDYLNNKNNIQKIKFPSVETKKILEPTNGVIIFQEQIIQMAQTHAGFTAAEGDVLRRVISKKKHDELLSLKDQFFSKAKKLNRNENETKVIFEMILKFADYGFNRSHAVAYSILGYQMAYLKANYPIAFFSCLLNHIIGDENKLKIYINEAKNFGIEFIYPNIFTSKAKFYISKNKIIMPLTIIKGLGISHLKELVQSQIELIALSKKPTHFEVFSILRKNNISKAVIEKLVEGGTFDDLNIDRIDLHKSIDKILNYVEYAENSVIEGFIEPLKIEVNNNSLNDLAKVEFAAFGFYLKYDPLLLIKGTIKINDRTITISKINQSYGEYILLSFITLIKVKKHAKNGQDYLLVKFSDETGETEAYIFNDCVDIIKQDIKLNSLVKVLININPNSKFKLNVKKIEEIKV